MNILVTGAGSLIGHGVLRSLREMAKKDFHIVTADPDYRAAGHWLGDRGVVIPLARDENYLAELKAIMEHYQIDVTFIGTDPELAKISAARSTLPGVAVVSHPDTIRIGDDKWETVQFLKGHGFAYPDSALSEDTGGVEELVARVGFPLIAKPRIGARSAGVSKVTSHDELLMACKHKGYVIQEYLSDESGEFTAGTMTFEGVCYSSVIFRRDLKDGNTYRAYLESNTDFEPFLERVSAALPGVFGPLNFQFRLRGTTPVIFEINSRFSGTTPLRTAIGVNEVEMTLQYLRDGRLVKRKVTHPPVAVFRTWSDIVIPMDELHRFESAHTIANPKARYFPFLKE